MADGEAARVDRLEQRILKGMRVLGEMEEDGLTESPKYDEGAGLMDRLILERLTLDPQGLPYLWLEERSDT